MAGGDRVKTCCGRYLVRFHNGVGYCRAYRRNQTGIRAAQHPWNYTKKLVSGVVTHSTRLRTSANRRDRRAQLIGETISLVGRYGYNGFTLKMLAEQCGMSNAGVLHYFPSKNHLFLGVLEEIRLREEAASGPLAAAAINAPASLSHSACLHLLRNMMGRIVGNPDQTRFVTALQLESTDAAHPAYRWFRDREADTQALFAKILMPGTGDCDAVANVLIAVMYGLTVQWLRADQDFDIRGEWERALRLILSAP